MITLAMLVKDPPLDRLAALLDYVAPVVGQVVAVVDDRTTLADVETMTALGVETHPFRWADNFAAARNAVLPYVQGDWVLHLDPDELPSAALLAFLGTVDRSDWRPWTDWQGARYPDPLGYLIWTRNYYDGRRGDEFEEHWHCRLFRREHGAWYKAVHEQVALDGEPETETRGTPLLPKAPRGAYLIHSRMNEPAKDALYTALGAGA